jgi:hypothetical protein
MYRMLQQRGSFRNEPFDDDELRALAKDLATLADQPAVTEPDPLQPGPGTVTGYRKQQPGAVAMVNEFKDLENAIGDKIEQLRNGVIWSPDQTRPVTYDPDLLRRGAEMIQTGFMLVNRAIFQPESRLKP